MPDIDCRAGRGQPVPPIKQAMEYQMKQRRQWHCLLQEQKLLSDEAVTLSAKSTFLMDVSAVFVFPAPVLHVFLSLYCES